MGKGDAKQTTSTTTNVITTTNNANVTQVGPTGLQGKDAIALTDILAQSVTTLNAQNIQLVSGLTERPLAPASSVITSGSQQAQVAAAVAAGDAYSVGGVNVSKQLVWSIVGGTLAIFLASKIRKGKT